MPAPEKPFYFPHRFCLCLVSLFESRLSIDLAINSFLSRTILVSNSVPLCLSRLHLCIRPDIYVNVFLTISSMHSSIRLPRLTSVFPTFPSAIFNFYLPAFIKCTLVPRSHLLLILLGSLSVPSSFSFPSRPFVAWMLFTFLNVVSYVPA